MAADTPGTATPAKTTTPTGTATTKIPGVADLRAHGKVTEVKDGLVIFAPAGMRYALHLAVAKYTGPINKPVKCTIRASARKVYTVPSGGNFITPIIGPPRIVQGLVRAADERWLVIQAGCPVHVQLPADNHAIDLDDGPIYLGRMVNVVCFPGARAEFDEHG